MRTLVLALSFGLLPAALGGCAADATSSSGGDGEANTARYDYADPGSATSSSSGSTDSSGTPHRNVLNPSGHEGVDPTPPWVPGLEPQPLPWKPQQGSGNGNGSGTSKDPAHPHSKQRESVKLDPQ
jgi:hypothetical protein